ncbi:hypothetical protein SLEP1_g48228 [Rubroshorea leprosula]|uniref:Uncharacterized protein n=1 Tax=Rubroshorea leprosula TaxID=152421 RepID=A0AAV5LV29_9ROSI|nr:hypothetical protein SLEP1_g48228 [Rubroshorea leprosula]
MRDWAAPLVAAALFAFLSPGVLVQLPGKDRPVGGFMNMQTSVASILVHAVLYFLLLVLFLVVLHIHIYA